jgi:uncharacterized protein (TIGR00251 family)
VGHQHAAARHNRLGVCLTRREGIGAIVTEVDGGVVITVHVQPRAGRTQITGRHGDALKIRVAAPPVEGRATEAARVALAEALRVAPATVRLLTGESSRLKRFRVDGLPIADAVARVEDLVTHGRHPRP